MPRSLARTYAALCSWSPSPATAPGLSACVRRARAAVAYALIQACHRTQQAYEAAAGGSVGAPAWGGEEEEGGLQGTKQRPRPVPVLQVEEQLDVLRAMQGLCLGPDGMPAHALVRVWTCTKVCVSARWCTRARALVCVCVCKSVLVRQQLVLTMSA